MKYIGNINERIEIEETEDRKASTAVKEEPLRDYRESIEASAFKNTRIASQAVVDRSIGSLQEDTINLESIAIDRSTYVRPEDFFSGEYRDDGSRVLVVSFFDLSSFVDFESDIFYNALRVDANTYMSDGRLVKAIFPITMLSQMFAEFKRTGTYPTVSVRMVFDSEFTPQLEEFTVFNSKVHLRDHLIFEEGTKLREDAYQKPIRELSKSEASIRILHEIAVHNTAFNPESDRRQTGEIYEIKKLALSHLSQSLERSRIPAVWMTRVLPNTQDTVPIMTTDYSTIQRGLNCEFDANALLREYYSREKQRLGRKHVIATDRVGRHTAANKAIKLRADIQARSSLALLNGYALQLLIAGDHTELNRKDLRRVSICRSAEINRNLTDLLS